VGNRRVATLALSVAATRPSLYLDLESPSDQAKLSGPELYLGEHEDKLAILDEVHRRRDLFEPLRFCRHRWGRPVRAFWGAG
jgi:uncharacterized protein